MFETEKKLEDFQKNHVMISEKRKRKEFPFLTLKRGQCGL